MARIKIITDSASDIPKKYAEKYNITVLPICVVIDGAIYRDWYDLESREYAKKIKDMDTIPTTSMVPVAMIEEEFRKNLETYDYQIFVTLSAKASGGNNAAHMIKQQIEDETGKESNIIVINSNCYSMMYGKAVIEMAIKAEEGAELDVVLSAYENIVKNSNAYFVVDDLKHLQKGGRIKAGAAFVGGVLGIKPILTISDGLVENIGKERGTQKAFEKIVELTVEKYDMANKPKIWIASADSDEGCNRVMEMLNERLGNPVMEMYDIGAVINTHAGSGVVGILFDNREE